MSLRHPIGLGKTQSSPAAEKSPPAARKPFAQIDHDIASDPRLTPVDVRVLLALLFYARAAATCWPSDRSIGERVGRSISTVQRSLRRLAQLGLIERHATAENPVGRVLVLLWRQRPTPMSSVTDPRIAAISDECRSKRDEERPRAGGQVEPTATGGTTEGDPAAERQQLEAWLASGDPVLRRIAKAGLATAGVVEPAGIGPAPVAAELSPIGDKPAADCDRAPVTVTSAARPEPAPGRHRPPDHILGVTKMMPAKPVCPVSTNFVIPRKWSSGIMASTSTG
jgi:hypothetical protein